jgi:diguanylate cyclase (GGDEF)-like protein/PAS domain S-box-containing protein
MNRRITGWRQSIIYLTVLALVGSGLFVGLMFMGATAFFTNSRAEQQSIARLSELLDTVESTVSIACFVEDQNLAAEVARGLMKNSDVLGVEIRGKSAELVRSYRADASSAKLDRARQGRQVRRIRSPFNAAEIVGEIIVDPDPETFDRVVGAEVRFVGFLLWLQLSAVVVATVATMLRLIVRPIKGMSDRLHSMDATAGDRLMIPKGWGGTEVGRLAQDVNALADQLVASLDDERQLRLLREIDEKKYRAIFDNAETGIFIADAEGRVESGNPALARLLNLPSGASIAGTELAHLAWKTPERLLRLIDRCLDQNAMCGADLEYRIDHGGMTSWLNVALSSIGGGTVQGIVSDVTERKLSEDTARRQAVTDPLTGASNRPGLEQRLLAAIRQHLAAADGGFALMLVDLDGFKRVNDALGLPVGDLILKTATERIQSCVKNSDMVARMGGDEFAVLLPGVTGEETAAGIGDRIVRILARNYDAHSSPVQLGASVGVTLFPVDGTDMPSLLRNAELALDRAKISGGNRYTFFDPAMAEAVARRRALETDMQLALRRNEFSLYYQPIVDLDENRLAGVEALIRWRHPERGLVAPDAFIPVAEETGFIVDIGLWALEAACRQLALWQAAGRNLYMSLNISGRQIPDGLPPQALAAAIARHGVEPWRLVLEITEGVLMEDVAKAQQWLAAVREQGMRFYLDDFGTGYSSLSYLKRFPVSTVKVDRAFVRDMHNDASDRALVGAIVAMAKSLGMSVVAEGVETLEQLDLLRAMGCRYGQGYYFSKPVPVADFDQVAVRVDAMLAAMKQPT